MVLGSGKMRIAVDLIPLPPWRNSPKNLDEKGTGTRVLQRWLQYHQGIWMDINLGTEFPLLESSEKRVPISLVWQPPL